MRRRLPRKGTSGGRRAPDDRRRPDRGSSRGGQNQFPQESLPVRRERDAPDLGRFTTVTIGHRVARAGPVELALRRASSGPGDCHKERAGAPKPTGGRVIGAKHQVEMSGWGTTPNLMPFVYPPLIGSNTRGDRRSPEWRCVRAVPAPAPGSLSEHQLHLRPAHLAHPQPELFAGLECLEQQGGSSTGSGAPIERQGRAARFSRRIRDRRRLFHSVRPLRVSHGGKARRAHRECLRLGRLDH